MSTTPSYSWSDRFLALFDQCVKKFESGNTDFDTYYSADDLAFLKSIGCKPRELFDFVEDYKGYGDPLPGTALLIAAVRRDYLKVIQHGQLSTHEVQTSELPAKTAEVDGIAWLPRIIVKARAKLHGEMEPDLMYGCGGDRRFLKEYDLHPADFLRTVWAAGDDDSKIIEYVKSRGRSC
ncbi:MAG: hypothetical protein JWM59_3417 [Verrucomicrobiales bacterium]|nr:hypothetical protein [Verrucomicrobiales bacterium]